GPRRSAGLWVVMRCQRSGRLSGPGPGDEALPQLDDLLGLSRLRGDGGDQTRRARRPTLRRGRDQRGCLSGRRQAHWIGWLGGTQGRRRAVAIETPTPLLERQRELAELGSALTEARQGR